jgi:hypothetical protein
LTLGLAVMVPAWSLIGAWQAPQARPWLGFIVGGGLPSRWADLL